VVEKSRGQLSSSLRCARFTAEAQGDKADFCDAASKRKADSAGVPVL
jgi:hypothetical protein